jgi:uncharacterized membrane protein
LIEIFAYFSLSKIFKLNLFGAIMKAVMALKVILILSIAGLLFSGYLSYSELFKGTCSLGTCTPVSGVPACVYGFFMYFAVLIVALLGLKEKYGRKK